MKQFLRRLLKFALFLPVAWGCVFAFAYLSPAFSTLFVAKPTLEGAVHQKSREFRDNVQDLDYLFLGSSTCYCGIDPHYFGNSFSLCSSAQKIGNSREIYDIALSHSTPKYVVIDIYPELWEGDMKSLESTRDWIINSPFYNGVEADDLYTYLLQFYFEIADNLGIYHKPYEAPKSDTYKGLGFVARDKEPLTENPCMGTSHFAMSEELADLILEIDDRTEVILVIPPMLCDFEYSIPSSLDGVRLIDGGNWPEAKNRLMYYDDHHLVSSGADFYSHWLETELIK